jgi:flagellar protein FliL
MLTKVLMILNFVIVLAGLGVVYYSHNMLKPEPTDQAAETQAMKDQALSESSLKPVPLKKIVVNLHSSASRLRYLDVEINILTFQEDQKQIIKDNEHIFKDALVEIGSQLNPEDLDTVTGKILLENRIKKKVNEKLNPHQPTIKQIFFSGFVVQ